MWSKCKQLCRLQAVRWGAVPPVVVLFHSISIRFISFRFALMASHGIAILIAMQKCVCHFWNWKAAGRRALLPTLYVWAWPALLFASGILLPAFGRELRNCQDRSKNYACHRKLFELEDNRTLPPLSLLSRKQLKKRHTRKTAKGFTWFKWQAATSTNGQLGASILLLEDWQENINIYYTTLLLTVIYKLYGKWI